MSGTYDGPPHDGASQPADHHAGRLPPGARPAPRRTAAGGARPRRRQAPGRHAAKSRLARRWPTGHRRTGSTAAGDRGGSGPGPAGGCSARSRSPWRSSCSPSSASPGRRSPSILNNIHTQVLPVLHQRDRRQGAERPDHRLGQPRRPHQGAGEQPARRPRRRPALGHDDPAAHPRRWRQGRHGQPAARLLRHDPGALHRTATRRPTARCPKGQPLVPAGEEQAQRGVLLRRGEPHRQHRRGQHPRPDQPLHRDQLPRLRQHGRQARRRTDLQSEADQRPGRPQRRPAQYSRQRAGAAGRHDHAEGSHRPSSTSEPASSTRPKATSAGSSGSRSS